MAAEQRSEFIQLGPWSGLNLESSPNSPDFAPGDRRAALTVASNVDISDSGWIKRRSGFTRRTSSGDGKALYSAYGLTLGQDGTMINAVDTGTWAKTPVVTGLSGERVVFHAHADQIFWTDGIDTGRIFQDGTATNWGCAVAPMPLLTAVAGSLREGRYMVACTFVDAAGVEHGAPEATIIDITDNQNISVSVSPIDPRAAYVKVYATKPNNFELFYVGTIPVASLPFVISDVEVSEEPLRTQHLSPPLPADGMFSYRGLLVLFADNFLFPSYGPNAHLYEITDIIESRPTKILAGVGLSDGFWVVCEDGAFWTSGADPESWQTWRRDNRAYAAGSLVLSGTLIPELNTPLGVALFVSEHGLVAGMPGGAIYPLMQDKIHLEVAGKRASIAYREVGDLRQVVWSLE